MVTRREFFAMILSFGSSKTHAKGKGEPILLDLDSNPAGVRVVHNGKQVEFTPTESWYLAEYVAGLMPHIVDAYKEER